METIDIHVLDSALAFLRQSWPTAFPDFGLVLGSGWNEAIDFFEMRDQIPYSIIPGLGGTTVAGHQGRLVWGSFAGKDAFLFYGRRHFFEGTGWTPIALPIYLLKNFGAKTTLLTNAAGIINPSFRPGQLMLITDHINLLGANPLCGLEYHIWGERFPDLSQVYDPELQQIMLRSAQLAGEDLKCGVYCACLGPSYETPAEVAMLGRLGVDAVGMSTVPCAILAKAAGLKVVALSYLTNYGAGLKDSQKISHAQVINASFTVKERMQKLLMGFIEGLPASIPQSVKTCGK